MFFWLITRLVTLVHPFTHRNANIHQQHVLLRRFVFGGMGRLGIIFVVYLV